MRVNRPAATKVNPLFRGGMSLLFRECPLELVHLTHIHQAKLPLLPPLLLLLLPVHPHLSVVPVLVHHLASHELHSLCSECALVQLALPT